MVVKQQGKKKARTEKRKQLKKLRHMPERLENNTAAAKPTTTLRDETICSICLDSFQDPVIIHCGHSFCRACITEYWKKYNTNACCPICRTYSPKKHLIPNRHLENIVENYKEHLPSNSPQRKRMCSKHKKALSLFCENDASLICTVCESSKAHQGHSVVCAEYAAEDYKNSALLDPETADSQSVMSPDWKSITWRDVSLKFPYSSKRFKNICCVFGSEGFASGKHYWTVDVGDGGWAVSVANASVKRKEEINFKPDEGITAMSLFQDQYKALTWSPTLLEVDLAQPRSRFLGTMMRGE